MQPVLCTGFYQAKATPTPNTSCIWELMTVAEVVFARGFVPRSSLRTIRSESLARGAQGRCLTRAITLSRRRSVLTTG